MSNIDTQIKALAKVIASRKAKNIFAIQNKIKKLQLVKSKQAYNEFLGR